MTKKNNKTFKTKPIESQQETIFFRELLHTSDQLVRMAACMRQQWRSPVSLICD